ncbi:monocarboxylate transporter 12-like [Pecten maximus]|uniref:monocarboxylate transporter 12-like n=1 Tax=Pecten maximus TaxID=6579 RepID=UPI001457FC6E|nr:monocarboxylate transporter 12-like [Pecten maximus]
MYHHTRRTSRCDKMEISSIANTVKESDGREDPNNRRISIPDDSSEMDDTFVNVDNSLVEESTPPDKHELSPPDGGWGWVIVFSSLMVHIILFGIEKSSGIFYLKFQEKFHQTAAATAWMTTVPGVLRTMLGPVCSVLITRYSCRSVTIVGAVLFGLSLLLTSFATELIMSICSFSILGGIGMCLVYSPAVIVVNQYFTTRRGLALGIATSCIGSFLFPNMIDFLFEFYGFLGAFLVLAGITWNIVVCGSLFRPLMTENTNKRIGEINKDSQPSTQKQSIQSRQKEIDEKATCCKTHRGFMCNSQCKIKQLVTDSRFVTTVIALSCFSISFQSAFVFIPLYAKQINIEESKTAYTVSITILFDGFGRIFFGAVLDIRFVKEYRISLYNLLLLLVGIASLTFPSTSTFAEMCTVCAIYGFMMGGLMSQKSVILVDIIGLEGLPGAFGILLLFQGVGGCIGPVISGFLKDISGSATGGFYFGGICTISGAAIFATANIVYYIKHKLRK